MNCFDIQGLRSLPQLYDQAYRQHSPEDVYLTTYSTPPTQLTFRELHAKSHCLAGYLLLKGLQQGDRVVILSDNEPLFICLDLAVQLAGGISVVLSHRFKNQHLAAVLAQAEPKFFLISRYITYANGRTLLDGWVPRAELICNLTASDAPQEGDLATALENAITQGKVYWREHSAAMRQQLEAAVPEVVASWVFKHRGPPIAQPITHGEMIALLHTAATAAPGLTRQDSFLSLLDPTTAVGRIVGFYWPLAVGCPLLQLSSLAGLLPTLAKQCPSLVALDAAGLWALANTLQATVSRRRLQWALRTSTRARAKQGKLPLRLKLNLWLAHRRVYKPLHKKYLGSLRHLLSPTTGLPLGLQHFYQDIKQPIQTGWAQPTAQPESMLH